MRRIVMFNQVTADGFFAAEDGGLEWARPDPEQTKETVARLGESGGIVFGRKTYELFKAFWPGAAAQTKTAPDPHHRHQHSEEILALAKWIDTTEKWVFSRTLGDAGWKNVQVLRELSADAVRAVKARPGKDLMLFGSGSICRQLCALGLIDEYQFMVSPMLLGRGRRLFDDVPARTPLRLRDARSFASGNVLLRYAPEVTG